MFIYFNDRIKFDGYDNINFYKQSQDINAGAGLDTTKILSFLAPPKKESTLKKD